MDTVTTTIRIVDMDTVRREHRGHWFDPGTLRFFRSRVARHAYESNDGRYRFFVSSEQHAYRDPYSYTLHRDPRLYSVRVQDTVTGAIDTVGTFQGYESRKAADNDARGYALDPADACSLIAAEGGSCPIHDAYHPAPTDGLAATTSKRDTLPHQYEHGVLGCRHCMYDREHAIHTV